MGLTHGVVVQAAKPAVWLAMSSLPEVLAVSSLPEVLAVSLLPEVQKLLKKKCHQYGHGTQAFKGK